MNQKQEREGDMNAEWHHCAGHLRSSHQARDLQGTKVHGGARACLATHLRGWHIALLDVSITCSCNKPFHGFASATQFTACSMIIFGPKRRAWLGCSFLFAFCCCADHPCAAASKTTNMDMDERGMRLQLVELAAAAEARHRCAGQGQAAGTINFLMSWWRSDVIAQVTRSHYCQTAPAFDMNDQLEHRHSAAIDEWRNVRELELSRPAKQLEGLRLQ